MTSYKSRLISLEMLPLMMEFELSDLSFFIKGIKYPGHFDIRHYVSFSSSSTQSGSFLKLRHKLAHRSSTRHFYFYRISRLWNALPMLNLDLSHSTLMRKLRSYFWTHFLKNYQCDSSCTYHFLCPCNKCSSLPPCIPFSML